MEDGSGVMEVFRVARCEMRDARCVSKIKVTLFPKKISNNFDEII
ncbi:hypothetical protein [Chryseobacterium sp. GP-SGM7]